MNDEILPPTPLPLTPSQIRARRMYKKRIIEQSIRAGYTPMNPPDNPKEPATKLFELEDLRRVEVKMDQNVKDMLNAGNTQSRALPVALAEEFGALEDEDEVDYIRLSIADKSKYFGVLPTERHPVSGEMPKLLEIDVYFKNGKVASWKINLESLYELNSKHQPAFSACELAAELHRLHIGGK